MLCPVIESQPSVWPEETSLIEPALYHHFIFKFVKRQSLSKAIFYQLYTYVPNKKFTVLALGYHKSKAIDYHLEQILTDVGEIRYIRGSLVYTRTAPLPGLFSLAPHLHLFAESYEIPEKGTIITYGETNLIVLNRAVCAACVCSRSHCSGLGFFIMLSFSGFSFQETIEQTAGFACFIRVELRYNWDPIIV